MKIIIKKTHPKKSGFFLFYDIFINKINNMKKVIRLTESDLMRIVKRVISEKLEGGQDFDHYNQIVVPMMTKYGFKRTIEGNGYGSGYFSYPNHNDGVNLFYDNKNGKYVVYMAPNKNLKEFKFVAGTESEARKIATDAANYAMSLKKSYERNKYNTPTVRGTSVR